MSDNKQDHPDSDETTPSSSQRPSSRDGASEASESAGAPDFAPSQELDPLAGAQAEAARLKDQLLRTAADFDNFRKRSRREIAEALNQGREDVLKDLLPVFDNLERAQDHAKDASDVSALADGISLVTKQFVDTLERLGIERIDARGQAFDPNLHEAIQQIETADFHPGAVATQVQAGYKLGTKLIRPAMVVVAKAPASRAGESSPPSSGSRSDTSE